jgi:predicted Zn-dependent peptidase
MTGRAVAQPLNSAGCFDPSHETKEIIERADVFQAKLAIGLRCDSSPVGDGFFALLVLNELFGGGPESLLFKNVREKESLCYYINSFLYRFKVILCVESGIDEADYEKTKDLIQQQFQEVKQGRFDSEAVEKAKQTLLKKMTGVDDYPQSVMDFYLAEKMLGQTGGIDAHIAGISKVTKEAVIDAASTVYFDTLYLLCGSEGSGKANG